jgi:hypothetical protein
VAAARRGGRDKVGCIVLGREDDEKVREWLTTAATVPGFVGFAVSRTEFWESLVGWRAKKTRAKLPLTKLRGGIVNSWTSLRKPASHETSAATKFRKSAIIELT